MWSSLAGVSFALLLLKCKQVKRKELSYLLFIMQLSQSSQHLRDGRAVHLHPALQKVSAMRNDLLLTLNSDLACPVGKSLSPTKSVTIQLAKAARGKGLLETFSSSQVSNWGNYTMPLFSAFVWL